MALVAKSYQKIKNCLDKPLQTVRFELTRVAPPRLHPKLGQDKSLELGALTTRPHLHLQLEDPLEINIKHNQSSHQSLNRSLS